MSDPTTLIQSDKILFIADKQCKGSVRYACSSEKFPVQSVYVSRNFQPTMPTKIFVQIEVAQ